MGVSAATLYIKRICVYNLDTRGHNSYLYDKAELNYLWLGTCIIHLFFMGRQLSNLKHTDNEFYDGWIIYLIDNNIQHIDQSNESREKLACQKIR